MQRQTLDRGTARRSQTVSPRVPLPAGNNHRPPAVISSIPWVPRERVLSAKQDPFAHANRNKKRSMPLSGCASMDRYGKPTSREVEWFLELPPHRFATRLRPTTPPERGGHAFISFFKISQACRATHKALVRSLRCGRRAVMAAPRACCTYQELEPRSRNDGWGLQPRRAPR